MWKNCSKNIFHRRVGAVTILSMRRHRVQGRKCVVMASNDLIWTTLKNFHYVQLSKQILQDGLQGYLYSKYFQNMRDEVD